MFQKLKLGRKRSVPISKIHPSPENAELYDLPTAENTKDLQEEIAARGLEEPIIVTKDYFVLSGHRRLMACQCLGCTHIWVRYAQEIRRDEMAKDEYVKLLARQNRGQRDKNTREKIKERWVLTEILANYRHFVADTEQEFDNLTEIEMSCTAKRHNIAEEKTEFVNAIKDVVNGLKAFWPITVRAIHYNLLKVKPRPIRNTKRKDRDYTYRNDVHSYQDLVRQTPRMRYFGIIPEESIFDPTRTTTEWKPFPDVSSFLQQQKNRMFDGYHRNLLQSQDRHVEVVAEKLTVESYLKSVVEEYKLNLTISRGNSSMAARSDLARRFRRSGKRHLTLLCLFDFDPDGEQLATIWKEYLWHDYGISCDAFKIALNENQADELSLIEATHSEDGLTAKEDSPNYARFVEKYGTTVYELEAMSPEQMQSAARNAIRTVLDMDLFQMEKEIEEQEIDSLEELKCDVCHYVSGIHGSYF